jgi:hypothetical protein
MQNGPMGIERSIFFNNARAYLQPRSVVARVIEHLRLEEQIRGYLAAELDGVYGSGSRIYTS